jgi:hypothetical protein
MINSIKSTVKDLFSFNDSFSTADPYSILSIIVISLFYGICLRYTYISYYRKDEPLDESIGRSFPLIAPAVALIFWLIQFSLPLSLGLLGALSFVRFRTPVKRAEDIAFIMIMIAGSLACSVGNYGSCLLLLIIIYLYGISKSKISFFNKVSKFNTIATITSNSQIDITGVEKTLNKVSLSFNILSSSSNNDTFTLVINIPKLSNKKHNELLKSLRDFDMNLGIDIYLPDNQLFGI